MANHKKRKKYNFCPFCGSNNIDVYERKYFFKITKILRCWNCHRQIEFKNDR